MRMCFNAVEAVRPCAAYGAAQGSELAARATEEVAEIDCPVAMLAANDSGPPRCCSSDGERGRREESNNDAKLARLIGDPLGFCFCLAHPSRGSVDPRTRIGFAQASAVHNEA